MGDEQQARGRRTAILLLGLPVLVVVGWLWVGLESSRALEDDEVRVMETIREALVGGPDAITLPERLEAVLQVVPADRVLHLALYRENAEGERRLHFLLTRIEPFTGALYRPEEGLPWAGAWIPGVRPGGEGTFEVGSAVTPDEVASTIEGPLRPFLPAPDEVEPAPSLRLRGVSGSVPAMLVYSWTEPDADDGTWPLRIQVALADR